MQGPSALQIVDDDDGNAAAGLGPSAEKITEKQVSRPGGVAHRSRSGWSATACTCSGVKSLAELPASKYQEAVQALERKRQ